MEKLIMQENTRLSIKIAAGHTIERSRCRNNFLLYKLNDKVLIGQMLIIMHTQEEWYFINIKIL